MLKAYQITESHIKNALTEAQQLKNQIEAGNHSLLNKFKAKAEETQSPPSPTRKDQCKLH